MPGVKVKALREEALPKRFKLLNWGRNESTQGTFVVGALTVAALAANQRKLGLDRIALDFEHNTVPGMPEYERSTEPRPVAAFGTPLLIPNDGLYIDDIEWRPRGISERVNYEDLSPCVGFAANGDVLFIHSAALCRNGSVHGLTISGAAALSAFFSTVGNPNSKMSYLTLAALAALIGLPESATEADVKVKLTGLCSASPAGELTALQQRLAAVESKALTGLVALTIKRADNTEVSLTPVQLAERVINLESQFAANGLAALSAERLGIITAMSAEGKAPVNPETGKPYSADELSKLDVAVLKALSANTPGTVPLSALSRQPRGAGASGESPEALRGRVQKYRAEHNCSFDEAFNAVTK